MTPQPRTPWQLEAERQRAEAALPPSDPVVALLDGLLIQAAIGSTSPLVNPRLSEIDWSAVAAWLNEAHGAALPPSAEEAWSGETWRCPSCRDTVAPMGMCQKCGIFGLRYDALPPSGDLIDRAKLRAAISHRPLPDSVRDDLNHILALIDAAPPADPLAGLTVERLAEALPNAHVGLYAVADLPSPAEWYREYATSILAALREERS